MDIMNKMNDVIIDRLSTENNKLKIQKENCLVMMESMEMEIEYLVEIINSLYEQLENKDDTILEQKELITKYEVLDMIQHKK